MVFHSTFVEARKKAGRTGKPAWSVLEYLERSKSENLDFVEKRRNFVGNQWNQADFDSTISSFPQETLIFDDTEVQSGEKLVKNFKEVCRVIKFMKKEGSLLKNKQLQANATVLSGCYSIYEGAQLLPEWIVELVDSLSSDLTFDLYKQLSITTDENEKRQLKNELKTMVAEAANEKVKSLSNYDEKSERGKLRAKNSRRESAMLTAGKLPPKSGSFL